MIFNMSHISRVGVTIEFSEMRGPNKIFGSFISQNEPNILFGPLISENSIITPPLGNFLGPKYKIYSGSLIVLESFAHFLVNK